MMYCGRFGEVFMVDELSLSGDFSLSMCFFNQDLMGVCLVGVGLLVGESSITTSLSWSWDASTSLQLLRMSMKKLKYWWWLSTNNELQLCATVPVLQ